MALPTTNLTAHFDASDTDNIFTTAGNPPSGTPVNGSAVQEWEDDDGKDLSLIFGEVTAEATWQTTTPLMALPCLDFNGTTDWYALWDNAGTDDKILSDIITASAYVVLVAFYVEGISTNAAEIYNNVALVFGVGDVWGIHLKSNAGAHSIVLYNWDGNEDTVPLSLNFDTSYVLVAWHAGGSIFFELYDADGLDASGNTASGDTSSLAGQFRVGRTRDAISDKFNGRIGELAIYNAHNATDRGNATTYFRQRWLGLAATGGTFALHG